jgi:hypothetical protein
MCFKKSNAHGVGHLVFQKAQWFLSRITLQVPSGYHEIKKTKEAVFTPSEGLRGRFVGNFGAGSAPASTLWGPYSHKAYPTGFTLH